MYKVIKRIEKHAPFINIILTIVIAASTFYTAKSWSTSNAALTETKKQVQGTFILDLNRDFFFNDRLYRLRLAIENDQPILQTNGGQFLGEDIDDYIGTFEMMSGFIDRGILDKDLVDDNFGAYISDAYQNKEIQNYVSQIRKNLASNDYYSGFEELGKEFSN